jgi:hypothetical protein
VFPNYGWAVAATAVFVIVSQLKINVTNAYAGSLAWSNFFSRLTHAHPGRVVWMVFNTGIALVLMEMNVFSALGHVLGLYSNVAIAWMMTVVADLVVNKPLGWSPKGIEFKRAHLYDINPVGVGAMGIASVLSVVAHLGAFGPMAQAFSALIALVTAFVASPADRLGDERPLLHRPAARFPIVPVRPTTRQLPPPAPVLHLRARLRRRGHGALPRLPGPDLLPVLHARRTLRRPLQARRPAGLAVERRDAPRCCRARMWPQLDAGLAHYLLLMALIVPACAAAGRAATRRPRACWAQAAAGADAARGLHRRLRCCC